MQPAAFVPLCLHAGGIRRALPRASTSQKHVDTQLGEGLTDKISPRSPRAPWHPPCPRMGFAPLGWHRGGPAVTGMGFPQANQRKRWCKCSWKKNRKRFPSAAHGAGGAAGTSPPLAGLLRKEPCQSSSSQIPSRRCSPVNSGCILPVRW